MSDGGVFRDPVVVEALGAPCPGCSWQPPMGKLPLMRWERTSMNGHGVLRLACRKCGAWREVFRDSRVAPEGSAGSGSV